MHAAVAAWLRAGIFVGIVATASSHGAVVQPLTRNAADRYPLGPNLCLCANATPGTATAKSTTGCANGQACYWYSQGCFIGCPTCDSISGRAQQSICNSTMQPTNNNPETCTVNRRNVGHPTLDIYRHNPWRAPGSAPVMDSCGLAGGTPCKSRLLPVTSRFVRPSCVTVRLCMIQRGAARARGWSVRQHIHCPAWELRFQGVA